MIILPALVSLIVCLLLGAVVLGLLWWLIGYVESKGIGPPLAYTIIRIIFVILFVLLLISILLEFLGHPLIILPR